MSNYSHSELSTYRNCPRAFYLQYVAGLVKRGDERSEHHLRFGFAFHLGLQTYYQGGTVEQSCDSFLSAYPRQLDTSDWAKTRENGVATLRAYFHHYKHDKQKYEILSLEQADRFESGGVVHLDRVILDRDTNNIYGMDTKTTGKYLDFNFYSRFNPNSQINRYVAFIIERYGHCDGFIIDAISLRHRQRAYKGEPAGFWYKFERQMFNPDLSLLQQEAESESYWTARIHDSILANQFGFNTDQCWHCTYHGICSAGYQWPLDSELIQINYRKTCGILTDELRRCQLDVGHSRLHSDQYVYDEDEEFAIEVE